MSLDNRFLLALQRAVLGFALVASTACGSDSPAPATDDDDVTQNDDEATADDDENTDDENTDDDETAKPAPRIDGGGSTTRDTGVKTPDAGAKNDAKVDTTSDAKVGDVDASDPPASGDGLIRGDAPSEQSASTKGPYEVKTYTSGYRDGPAYADSTIHYPTNADAPFAIVAVVPGFVSPQSSIQPWGPFLASHGIVTITIGTNTPGDLPDARAAALLDALKTLESENERADSPIKGQLDLTRQATMGWSMGGGGTLLAAETKQDLKATISLCGWNPGYQYAKIKSPALMFAATSDPLAGGQSQGFYASIPESTPKMLWEAQGQSHSYANNPAGMSGAIGRYGLSWMKTYLEDDPRYKQFLTAGKPAGTTADYKTNVQ